MSEDGFFSDRTLVAVVLVAIVLISTLGVGTILFPPPPTLEYSFEWTTDDLEFDISRYVIRMTSIDGAAVNISFVDDPDLIARLDYELYPNNIEPLSIDDNDPDALYISSSSDSAPKTIDLVLGNGVSYALVFRSNNISVTVLYDNGADIRDALLRVECPASHLDFTLTDNVTFSSDASFDIRTESLHSADVHISCPEGLEALVSVKKYHSKSLTHSSDWFAISSGAYPYVFVVYVNSGNDFPPLEAVIEADHITGHLS